MVENGKPKFADAKMGDGAAAARIKVPGVAKNVHYGNNIYTLVIVIVSLRKVFFFFFGTSNTSFSRDFLTPDLISQKKKKKNQRTLSLNLGTEVALMWSWTKTQQGSGSPFQV